MTLITIIASRKFWQIIFLIWVFIIFWMSLDPAPPFPEPQVNGWDKLLHAIAYGFLTLFGGLAMKGSSPIRFSNWFSIAGAAISLGGIMELFQKTFTTTRTAEFADFLADAFGAGVVLFAVFCTRKYQRRRSCKSSN